MDFVYLNPVMIHFGRDSVKQLPAEIKKYGGPFGGCSCMDMAKIIAFGVKNDKLWDYLSHKLSPKGKEALPVGEIPTFPSGGSEVDSAAEIDKALEAAEADDELSAKQVEECSLIAGSSSLESQGEGCTLS